MNSQQRRDASALSEAAYGALIRSYPVSFRAAYENEMRWTFSCLCADAISVRGWTISEEDAGDLEFHLVDRPF